jgi:hypothetical protein
MAKKRGFKTMFQLRDQIFNEWEKGIVKGSYCGFENFYNNYSMKQGATTYVYGHPFAGKSLVWFEMSMSLTELYGYNHVIFSPETGEAKKISAKLIAMYLRKNFYKGFQNSATEKEIDKALTHLNEHFFLSADDEDFSDLTDFYEYCDQISQDNDKFIHQTIVDPYNELESRMNGEARDIFTGKQLKNCRQNAIKKKRHNTIITHCKDIQPLKAKDEFGNEFSYYPAPRPQELLNGQEFHRKGMMMVAVWRPNLQLKNESGLPYQENETLLIVQKYKDEHSGSLGASSIFYDKHQHRFYEKWNGNIRYSGKRENQITSPLVTETPF